MIFIGIDPGLSGAIAVIDGSNIDLIDTPIIKIEKGKTPKGNVKIKNKYNLWVMCEILKKQKQFADCKVFIERAQAMPKQGVSSMFSIGYGFAAWEMACVALNMPYEIVGPKTWQKEFGIAGKHTKEESYIKCCQLYPEQSCKLKTVRGRIIDGKSDALLICEFGRRKMKIQ
jgi:crossover junction endodeoxyribonuclease RuvC